MILLDTNILVYAHDLLSEHYEAANHIVSDANSGLLKTCLSPQNLLELYAVITNPRKVSNSLDPATATDLVESYFRARSIQKIYPTRRSYGILRSLLRSHPAKKAEIFDHFLVATMLTNEVTTIYTENVAHFERFGFLTVQNPL